MNGVSFNATFCLTSCVIQVVTCRLPFAIVNSIPGTLYVILVCTYGITIAMMYGGGKRTWYCIVADTGFN